MLRLLLLCSVCVFGLGSNAYAQWEQEMEPEPELELPPVRPPARVLQGHQFVPFTQVAWPFVATQVSSRTGMGFSDLDVLGVVNVGGGMPVTISKGNITDNAKLISFSETFELALAITDWLGLDFNFAGANAVGVNESGAFNAGVNYAFGGQLGAIVKLAHGDNWYLSTRIDASTLYLGAVVPVELAEGVTVQNGAPSFDVSSIAVTGHRVAGAWSLALAANPSSLFHIKRKSVLGLQSSTSFQVARNDIESFSVRQLNFLYGLGASARFNQFGVPLALLLGGDLKVRLKTDGSGVPTSALAPAGKTQGAVEAGLFYSDLTIDVGGTATFEFSGTERRTVVRIIINHFW